MAASSLGLAGGALAAELSIRALLFSDIAWIRDLGHGMRIAANFADGESEEDYWKLRHVFADPASRQPAPGYDPELGWTGRVGRTENSRCPPDARQLVLLYGDSFAQCTTPTRDCFPALLERSALGPRFCMVNYGVGGYGLDQIYLKLRRTLDRHADRQPIVIVGVLVDSDLDRSVLSLRDWPKPRLVERGDELVLSEPVPADTEAYLEKHPLGIQSYLLRYLAFSDRPLPKPELRRRIFAGERVAEKSALNRRILREIHLELSSRGLRYFYLLFHQDNSLRRSPLVGWREQLVRDTAAELGTSVISTRPYLLAAGCGDAEIAGRFYDRVASGGHHSALGNAVCFEAVQDGLEGRFDPRDLSYIAGAVARGDFECTRVDARSQSTMQTILGRPAWVVARSASACVRHGAASASLAELWGGSDRVCLRAGEWGATEVIFELGGTARAIHGTARSFTRPAADCPSGRVGLVIEADGRTLFRATHPLPAEGIPVDLDLSGVRRLKLMAQIESGRPYCDWVCLSNPTIE